LLLRAAGHARLHHHVGTGGGRAGPGVQAQLLRALVGADEAAGDVLVAHLELVRRGEAPRRYRREGAGRLIRAQRAQQRVGRCAEGTAAGDAVDPVRRDPGGVLVVPLRVDLEVVDVHLVPGTAAGPDA